MSRTGSRVLLSVAITVIIAAVVVSVVVIYNPFEKAVGAEEGFSKWGEWSLCSVTCGGSVQHRQRRCKHFEPENHGRDCIGNFSQSQTCAANKCPAAGHWGKWGEWGHCTCSRDGSSSQSRSRLCDSPAPEAGGAYCPSLHSSERRACYGLPDSCPAPGEPAEWTSWAECISFCGMGASNRSRTCKYPHSQQQATKECPFSITEEESCTQSSCANILMRPATRGIPHMKVLSMDEDPVACALKHGFPSVNGIQSLKYKDIPVYCKDQNTFHCYQYLPGSSSWLQTGQLSTGSQVAARIETSNYHLITGGLTARQELLSATEQSEPNAEEFPDTVLHHCLAHIDNTRALLTGGHNGQDYIKNVYMFNKGTKEWTQMDSMVTKRGFHMCGLVGNSKVVVAGGISGTELSSVEIFDLQTETWSSGPDLPQIANPAPVLQFEDTFLILNDYPGEGHSLKKVYEYDDQNNRWLQRNEMVKVEGASVRAVYRLPTGYFECR